MITIERTIDPDVLSYVWNHPGIRPLVWDQVGDIPLLLGERIYHFGILKDGVLSGLSTFIPVNPVAWNPHLNILPEHRGIGTEAMRLSCAWIFANTPCIKLVSIPTVRERSDDSCF